MLLESSLVFGVPDALFFVSCVVRRDGCWCWCWCWCCFFRCLCRLKSDAACCVCGDVLLQRNVLVVVPSQALQVAIAEKSLILNTLCVSPPPFLLPFLLFSPRHQYAGARGGGSAPRGARAGWGSGYQGGARGQGVGARAEGFQRGVGHGPAPRGSVAGGGGGQVRRTGAARDAVMWYRLASYFCCGKYCCVGFRAGGLRSPVPFFLAPNQGMQSAVSAGCWFLVTTTS